MIILIGIKKASYKQEEIKHFIAEFSSREKAYEYIENSRTDAYNGFCSALDQDKQFKKESLLYGFAHADVYCVDALPLDPIFLAQK